MKIIIPLVGTFGNSGGFRVLSQLANHWISSGNEVVFLSYDHAQDPYFPTKADIKYYNNQGNITSEKRSDKQKPVFGMFAIRKALRKALDQMEADVVLANHCLSALPVRKSTIKAKKMYYIQAYEPEYYEGNSLKNIIFRQIAENSYSLGLRHIVNADMYKNYKQLHASRIVYPGLDLEVFKPHTEKEESSKFIIGSIGRVESYKGTQYIIEAFSKLRTVYKENIELHFAFGLEKWNEIEGITVFFPNGDESLAKFYNSIDAYICAGTLQLNAIHYPVLESFATKVPVITTGYFPASNENAWMIPIKDTDAIKDAVVHLLSAKEGAKRKTDIGFINIQQFSWEITSAKMLNYFKEN